MTLQEITEYLDHKIEENENEIIIKYFEIRVKKDLSEEETDIFLAHCKTRLERLGYQVFFTGSKFVYENANRTVQDNELMVAIKEQ